MSEASRSAALQHAVAHHKQGDAASDVLGTAIAFHQFIMGAPAFGEDAGTPGKVARVNGAKGGRPPKVARQTEAQPEPEAEPEVDDNAVTKEQVGEAVKTLLMANMGYEASKLFKKYDAKSLSSLKPGDYAAFKADADDLLLSV